MKTLLTSALLIVACAGAQAAEPMSLMTYYFKASKALTGKAPSEADQRLLMDAAAKNEGEQFVEAKIKTLVSGQDFTKKLQTNVIDLFRMKSYQSTPDSAFDNLVSDVVTGNQSWDQLLLAKKYRYKALNVNSFEKTPFFYNNLLSTPVDFTENDILSISLNPDDVKETVVQFDVNDPRLAGVITTPRFFGRYANTALNKNRRRAGAIFRVFLCDSMAPVIPPTDAASSASDFDVALPGHQAVTEDQIRQSVQDPHGQQADCKSCHYKLDPLGQTLGLSSSIPSGKAAPGALRYSGSDGRKVNIAVQGIGALAQAIVAQPEYAQCQVQHFWNWYIGKDVPVSRELQKTLVAKFNEVGRKPQDFVKYLVTTPAFRQKSQVLSEDQIMSRRVVGILKNCNSCHQNLTDTLNDIEKWDMTDLPYGKTPAERQGAIDILKEVLDIKNNGAKKEMPPRNSMWKLSNDEFGLLKSWLEKGAPDFSGKPQVTP